MRRWVPLAVAVLTIAACNTDNPGGGSYTGTVAGTLKSSLGGALAGIRVVVYETEDDSVIVRSNSSGAWQVDSVPVGSGTVQVESLPANCDSQPPFSYYLASPGTTASVNVTITCKAGQALDAVSGVAFDNVRRESAEIVDREVAAAQ
jgi:hypothetical protein